MRIAIFAHYDRDNIIDDYVVDYLQKLSKVAQHIIFVSDCDLSAYEQQKITGMTLEIIARRHGEYDFGSYKRGFNLLLEKHNDQFLAMNELIFANDSCYAVNSFEPVFEKMAMKSLDAWSMTEHNEHGYHLQSYFLVFRRTVFLEPWFKSFIQSIKKLESKKDIIKTYEIGMSALLLTHHQKICSYFGKPSMIDYVAMHQTSLKENLSKIVGIYARFFWINKLYRIFIKNSNDHYNYLALLHAGSPLLKVSWILQDKTFYIFTCFGGQILEKYTSYDIGKIKTHHSRVRSDSSASLSSKISVASAALRLMRNSSIGFNG